MPRKQHNYHYIYKVICIITGKYYIGMHSTSNLEDGYFGSGKVLKRSLNKYGKENHKIEILEKFKDRNSLKNRERELVTEELLKDPICMNLKIGGEGGLCNEEHKIKWNSIGVKVGREKIKELRKNKEWSNKTNIRISEGLKLAIKNGTFKAPNRTNIKHSDKTKEKIGLANSITQKGSYNSQYGTCWITNENENRKIHNGDLIPEGWRIGRILKIK